MIQIEEAEKLYKLLQKMNEAELEEMARKTEDFAQTDGSRNAVLKVIQQIQTSRKGQKMKIITLSNQKGGVAKTTTALALATGLSNKGFKVLAIDLDPQANFTFASGVDIMQLNKTIYGVFNDVTKGNPERLNEAITKTEIGFDLVPSELSLASADMEFTRTGREYMLSDALKALKGDYDYIVIDTPPTLGILTINALAASDTVIVPMAAEVYAVQGFAGLNKQIQNVQKYCNPRLQIAGFLLTRYNERQNVSKATKEMIESVAAEIGTKLFKTVIRESVAVKESALLQSNMFREAPQANATIDYMDFINELFEEGVL